MKKSTFVRSLFALFLSAVMVISVVPTGTQAASTAEIKEELAGLKQQNAKIQAQIDELQGKYDANASEIKDLVAKKDGIDQEIGLLHTQIENLNAQIVTYGQMIADSQDQLEAAEKNLNELNQKYKERIRAMEEAGSISYWQVIFESHSFTDLLDRLDMVEEIAEADQRRLDQIQHAAEVVTQTKAEMESERYELEEASAQLAESEAALEEKRAESDEVLRQLAKKQDEFQELLDESEAMQDALMRSIAKKQKELAAAEYQEKLAKMALQGQNPPSNATWRTPVSGYVITSAFGYRKAPTAGASTYHQGIDMACNQGTPIYATRAGTVTAASFQAGGAGYYVSINHGDGFGSIYMHMTHYTVSAGQKVSQGQLIGYVGSTGVSTGPHLHFGISYAGTYVNPLAYI